MPKRSSSFSRPVSKLIEARVLVAKTDARLFDALCGFTFHEGLRVGSLRRVGRVIEFDPEYVRLSSLATLAERLAAIGRRAR